MSATVDVQDESSRAQTAAEAFVQHWARTRIDQPGQLVARHDDAAKQLIAVTAFLQGVYLAAFTFGDLSGRIPLFVVVIMFLPLLSTILGAARVICTVPMDLNVHRAFQLLTRRPSDSYLSEVDAEIKRWCDELDRVAERKARWLHWANRSFIGATLVTVGLLIAATMM